MCRIALCWSRACAALPCLPENDVEMCAYPPLTPSSHPNAQPSSHGPVPAEAKIPARTMRLLLLLSAL